MTYKIQVQILGDERTGEDVGNSAVVITNNGKIHDVQSFKRKEWKEADLRRHLRKHSPAEVTDDQVKKAVKAVLSAVKSVEI